eukprot:19182-Heterococcus_DN1.PRE.8
MPVFTVVIHNKFTKKLVIMLYSLQDALATARRAVGTDTSSWLTPSATSTTAASSNSGASAAAAAKATAAAQTIITAVHTLVHKELRKLDSIEAQRGQARAALMQCTERVAAATAAATAAGVAAAARVAEALRSAETAIQAVTELLSREGGVSSSQLALDEAYRAVAAVEDAVAATARRKEAAVTARVHAREQLTAVLSRLTTARSEATALGCDEPQGVASSVQRALQLITAAQSAVSETDDDTVSAQLATANDRSTPSSSSHSSNGSSSVAAAAVRAVTDALRAAEEAESALIKTQSHQRETKRAAALKAAAARVHAKRQAEKERAANDAYIRQHALSPLVVIGHYSMLHNVQQDHIGGAGLYLQMFIRTPCTRRRRLQEDLESAATRLGMAQPVAEEVAASAEAAMAAVKAARAIVDSEERSSNSNSNSNNSEATAAVMQALETVQGLEAAVNTVSANLMYATQCKHHWRVEMGQSDGASSRGGNHSNINSSGTSGVSVEGYMGRSTLAVEALTANMHFLTQSMLSMNQLMQHQARQRCKH